MTVKMNIKDFYYLIVYHWKVIQRMLNGSIIFYLFLLSYDLTIFHHRHYRNMLITLKKNSYLVVIFFKYIPFKSDSVNHLFLFPTLNLLFHLLFVEESLIQWKDKRETIWFNEKIHHNSHLLFLNLILHHLIIIIGSIIIPAKKVGFDSHPTHHITIIKHVTITIMISPPIGVYITG